MRGLTIFVIEGGWPRMNLVMSRRALCFQTLAVLAVLAPLLSCSGSEPNAGSSSTTGGSGSGSSSAGSGASQAGTTAGGGSDGGPVLMVGGSPGSAGSSDGGELCATVTATTTLEAVHLAFAFDVSGSMGKGDQPWHDAKLKWDPVVAATRGFFEDPASAGLFASLTAFPIDADEDDRCESKSYTEADVAMVELPSPAFGEKLTEIRSEDWRGGTPTLAVVQGVQKYIDAYRQDHPGRYALVLVTDGYPQGCDDDSIDAVQDAVQALASDVPTYVIGVKNPPLVDDDGKAAPDTVSNLAGVAKAGGTESPFIIDTGDANQTASDFQAAIEKIRGVSIACNLKLPLPPDRRAFEKDQVAVSYSSGATKTTLSYDESCSADAAWHYDDVDAPTEVVLCPAACSLVQASLDAELGVDFTCEPVINLPR